MAKVFTDGKLLSLLFFGFNVFNLFARTKAHLTTSVYIGTLSESVLLMCSDTYKLNRRWKYEDIVLFTNAAVLNDRFKDSVFLLANYSLSINPILIQNEGSYSCLNGSSTVRRYQLIVKVSKISSEVVAAVDINEVANKVYRFNFPDKNLLQRNIQSVTLKDFSRWNADIFLMSPPCQPFTRVGLKGDKTDPRTSSFLYLLETFPKLSKKPTYLLVENVKGFETSDTRNELVDTLKKCNYKYKEFLLSPKDLGIPNQRLRYFLIAKQDSLQFHGDVQFSNGNTLLSHEISLEDNIPHSHESEAPYQELLKDSGEASPRLGDSATTGENDHIINDSSNTIDGTHNKKNHNPEQCLNPSEIIRNASQSQKDKNFIDTSDLMCGSRSIKDYLQELSDEEFEDYLVPEKILARFGKVMDIVLNSDERTCCFTKAYGHYVEGTGSFLQTNSSVTKHWAFEQQEDLEEANSRLQQLRLRYFTPREIANFHHFPHEFKFPSDVSRKQQYRLLGNSLNACVVAVLLRYLVNSQDTDT